jgi:flagellar protein FlbD
MITLHRLGHAAEPFHLNPDLIITVEANPDTVISLTNGTKVVVAEPPERVVREILDCRVEILSEALRRQKAEHTPGSGIASRRAALALLTTVADPE